MKRLVWIVPLPLLLLLVAAAAWAVPGSRLQVVSHVRPAGYYNADVFAHRGFAYVSSEYAAKSCPATGVRVLSLRDLKHPRRVATFGRVEGTWTEKTIVRSVRTAAFTGDLAVTTFQRCRRLSDSFQGFGVYDVTTPAKPRTLALVSTEPGGSHEIWLAAPAGRAYVYTAIPRSELRSGEPDFRIFDVSNPRAPAQVGAWGAIAQLGVPAAQGVLVHSVIANAAARRAYLSYWDLGTVILDVSDPAHPRYLGRTPTDQCCAHSAALDERRQLLIETHETTDGHPTVYDVSNPARPRLLATIEAPVGYRPGGSLGEIRGYGLTRSVHDPRIVGTTAFFSWYSQGVVAVDLAQPSKPRIVARYLPKPTADPESLLCPGRACTAVWGVYPLGPKTVLASDLASGLWVLRLR
jgi:hypothetical protein